MMGLQPPHAVPDFVLQPELLEAPQWAAMSAGAYWDDHELNALADSGDLDRMTRIINGGRHGLAVLKARYARALRFLCCGIAMDLDRRHVVLFHFCLFPFVFFL